MPDPSALLPPTPDPTPEARKLLIAEVLEVGATLRVVVPSLSGRVVEIERWQGETPRVGDEILIGHDDEGNEWMAGLAGPPGGMRVGVRPDYMPPDPRDIVLGDPVYPGGAGVLAIRRAGLVGGYFSGVQKRWRMGSGVHVVEANDPAELGLGRIPGRNTVWPTGHNRFFRKHPPGGSTIVASDSTGTELWLRRVDWFPATYDGTGQDFTAGGQVLTWTGQNAATALLCGDVAIGDTEIIVAENPNNALPSAARPSIANRQGIAYTSKSLALDGAVDGNYMAGATNLVVRNVTAAEWDNVAPDGGYIKVVTVNATRRWPYTSATYDSGTGKITFVIGEGKFDENIADGAAVTLHKLSGITSEFECQTKGSKLIGSQTLELNFIHPDTLERTDQALIDTIPDSGYLRVETHVVDGSDSHDFPTQRLAYTAFDGERITLADPLTAEVPEGSWVEIEGCAGLTREGTNGNVVVLVKYTGVVGLTGTISAGAVAEYSPRKGNPSRAGSTGFVRGDQWLGGSWSSPHTLLSFRAEDDGIGTRREGSLILTLGRPIGGRKQQVFMTTTGLGVALPNESLVAYPIHAWDFSCRAQAPGFEVEQPDTPPEDDEEPPPDEGGYILTGTLYVNHTLNAKPSGYITAQLYDRINGTQIPGVVLAYTGLGAEGVSFTGLSVVEPAGRPLSDFYVKGGIRFTYADQTQSVTAGFDTNGLFGVGREYEVEVGNVGPAGESGIRLGLADPRTIYKTDTGIEVDGIEVVVGADLTAHAAVTEGVHGLPNAAPGEAIRRNAGDNAWEAFDPATQAELDAHTGDTTAAHAASAISFDDTGNLEADDVQAAIVELDSEKAAKVATAARVTHSATQSIPDTTITVLTFDTEQYDTSGMHDGTNPTRLTAPVAGIYHIMALVAWAANATSYRVLQLFLNNTTQIAATRVAPIVVAGVSTDHMVATDYQLAAGDYVEVRVQQLTGAALLIQTTAPRNPQFSMRYVGAAS